ncbi:MAG: hypothetical protein KKE01_06385 [Candidatus Omnitrophica bacterium]|nr:hypothetical protein [Candidatus Omnitrophota bacterium]
MMCKRTRKNIFSIIISITILASSVLYLSSCSPTYPKEKLPEAIKEILKGEYGMDVDVAVAGTTLGIYHPMKGLLDISLGISEKAWDQISNLILVASRIVLSTDADIKFYCVIAQDERLPEMQIVIIKYVNDVKRGMLRSIGRSESFKRTLFSLNLTPQARKERSVEQVFDKMGLAEDTREGVLNEFFRASPSKLSDMGYWRGHFYLKDITLREFLAAQIANRIKIDFGEDEKLSALYEFQSVEGYFSSRPGDNAFVIKFKIFDQSKPGEEEKLRAKKIEKIMQITNEVVNGYEFKEFDVLEMEDQLENIKLWITVEDVCNYSSGQVPIEDIVKASGKYF